MMEITNTLNSGMCRCCSSEGTFKDIKTKYHWMGEEEIYADMLTDCFDIKICTPEDMDNGICEVCITQLRNASNFKKQVLHTEEQFKRRLLNKDVKNPIKLESVDDPIESDHLSDADFSGTEYEVPIKEELEEKPKAKKRAAKATTSRAKKAKPEAEASKKRNLRELTDRNVTLSDWDLTELDGNEIPTLDESDECDDIDEEDQIGEEQTDRKQIEKGIEDPSSKRLPILNVKQNKIVQIGKDSNFQKMVAQSQRKSKINITSEDIDKDMSNVENIEEYEAVSDSEHLDENRELSPGTVDYDLDPEESSQSPTNSVHIFKSEIGSPSTVDDIDISEPVSPTYVEYIDETEDFASNIEYLDETEEEFRLTESIQKSKARSTIQSKLAKDDNPEYHLRVIKTVIKEVDDQKTQVKYHHEKLRTILRCSNATTFSCSGIWYLCSICRGKYTDAQDLKEHTLTAHTSLKSLRILFSARQMKRYIIKLDITDLYCKLCLTRIDSLKDLLEHLDTEHGEPIHRDLPNHIIPFKFGGDVLRCTECDREFAFFKMLLCHMNDHYKNYICEVCDTAYVSLGSLTQHMRLHADGEYTCKWCQKLFDNKHKLGDHMKIVHFGQNKRNKCAYCDMKFLVFETRNKHMEEVHGLKAPVIQCQACEKSFRSTRQLTAHTKKFHLIGEKRHECSLCDRRFFELHMLKEHMAVHSNEKDFKCVVCDKAFSRKKTLREHIRIHANDRRFKCEYCGMAFVQKCSLLGHLKSKHTGVDCI